METREERNARIRREKARQIAASLEVSEAAKQIEYLYADASVTSVPDVQTNKSRPKGFLVIVRKVVAMFLNGGNKS